MWEQSRLCFIVRSDPCHAPAVLQAAAEEEEEAAWYPPNTATGGGEEGEQEDFFEYQLVISDTWAAHFRSRRRQWRNRQREQRSKGACVVCVVLGSGVAEEEGSCGWRGDGRGACHT